MSAGFIGLGNIGKPMALHWAGGKQALVVFDMVPQATVDLVAAGAGVAATVAELARDAALVDRCRPLLTAGGNAVVHAGPVGAAIALKLCNNMMTYASFIAIHEAYKLAQAFGIDPEMLHQVSNTNGVITPSMAGFIRARGEIAKQGEAVLQG